MSNFIADITKFAASNDSQGLLIEILKQSEYLEETDKTKSLQLLAIAEGLVEEMTVSAGIFDKIRGVSDVLRGKEKEQEKQPVPFERQKGEPPKVKVGPPAQKTQQQVQQPVAHNISEGRIDQPYQSIPALQRITADRIRITSPLLDHINRVFAERLHTLNLDIRTYGKNLENQTAAAIKRGIFNGIVIRSLPAEDMHNPDDRMLDMVIYIDLSTIDQTLEGTAEIKVVCRFSAKNGTLTLRNIQRNFEVSEPERDEDFDDTAGDYGQFDDQIDYDDRD